MLGQTGSEMGPIPKCMIQFIQKLYVRVCGGKNDGENHILIIVKSQKFISGVFLESFLLKVNNFSCSFGVFLS